jgi:hypothetical protein
MFLDGTQDVLIRTTVLAESCGCIMEIAEELEMFVRCTQLPLLNGCDGRRTIMRSSSSRDGVDIVSIAEM